MIVDQCRAVVRPVTAWLTVNRRCNFRCKWCYGKGTGFDTSKEMSLSFATEMIRLFAGAGVKNIVVIGGEPTLWKPLQQFNVICHDAGLKSTIVTNAMRFGRNSYWRDYLKSPNSAVSISLKAGSPSQLLEVASVGQYELVTKGISRAVERFQTGVSITYNTHYTNSLVEMARYAMSCGAKWIKIDFCTTVFEDGQPLSTYMVPPRELVANIVRDYPTLEEITNGNLVFEMSLPLCLWPQDFVEQLKAKHQITTVCHMAKRQGIVVSHDGQLLMCNGLFDYPIGQYRNHFADSRTLIAYLNSEEVNNYYTEITRYPSTRCQQCRRYVECGGGCPLRWAIYDPEELVTPIS